MQRNLPATHHAADFIAEARRAGFKITRASGCVVTIQCEITPGDESELTDADMSYGTVLNTIPTTRERNQWGTDCGGIGALAALSSGRFIMNQSGCKKNVVKQVAKQLAL